MEGMILNRPLQTVINYHITEHCNFACQFCFAKYGLGEQFSDELHHDLFAVARMFDELERQFGDLGDVRLNFVGGEPTLVKNFEPIIDLALKRGFSTSIVTNGSTLTKQFIERYAPQLSVLGVSIDSFYGETNLAVGRATRSGKMVEFETLVSLIGRARELNPGLVIKVNTVVNALNKCEDMTVAINQIRPDKWKIFQVLPEGEKRRLLISDDNFTAFVSRHRGRVSAALYAEDNEAMTESYIMIDPLGRFMQNSGPDGARVFSDPILGIGAELAFNQVNLRSERYRKRYVPLGSIETTMDSLSHDDAAVLEAVA